MSSSTVGQALGTASYTLEHEGKVYSCSLLFQDEKTQFENLLTARALRMLETMRKVYSPEDYEREREALLSKIEVGDFCFHGPLAVKALKTPAGILSLAAILFHISEDEAIKLMLARKAEMRTILDAALAASLAKVKPDEGAEGNG